MWFSVRLKGGEKEEAAVVNGDNVYVFLDKGDKRNGFDLNLIKPG